MLLTKYLQTFAAFARQQHLQILLHLCSPRALLIDSCENKKRKRTNSPLLCLPTVVSGHSCLATRTKARLERSQLLIFFHMLHAFLLTSLDLQLGVSHLTFEGTFDLLVTQYSSSDFLLPNKVQLAIPHMFSLCCKQFIKLLMSSLSDAMSSRWRQSVCSSLLNLCIQVFVTDIICLWIFFQVTAMLQWRESPIHNQLMLLSSAGLLGSALSSSMKLSKNWKWNW
jgi:hypothetical protein